MAKERKRKKEKGKRKKEHVFLTMFSWLRI
jgi:hypothetical protein